MLKARNLLPPLLTKIIAIGLAINAVAANSNAVEPGLQEHNIRNFGLSGTHTIALTFDDGPGEATNKILKLLKKYHLHATFFSIGENGSAHEATLKRIIAEGHVVGNHTWTHPNLGHFTYRLHPEQVVKELTSTDKIVREVAPLQKHIYFRAPYGGWMANHAKVLNEQPQFQNYIGPIYWDVGTLILREILFIEGPMTDAADWQCWDHDFTPEHCMQGYLAKLLKLDGGVVLSHDIYAKTGEMWELLLPILVKKGFHFVTLDEVPALQKYRDVADKASK
jgi:peptidoglycan/xylan/chitin deacetylase (PgdA/CDA1 family)